MARTYAHALMLGLVSTPLSDSPGTTMAFRHVAAITIGVLPPEPGAKPADTARATNLQPAEDWIDKPKDQWPQIAMVNNVRYKDKSFEVAGCGFLVDTGEDVFAVTAKHVLVYFKSESMDSVSFEGTLERWAMFPKNSPTDIVVVDKLLNDDPAESIAGSIPVGEDWLVFSIREQSSKIKPLKFRTDELPPGERVYIIGWKYTDKGCPQRIHEGRIVRVLEDSVLIATVSLADNTMPGLSGAPVIDSRGHLVGTMSRKSGTMELASSTKYPRAVLVEMSQTSAGN